MIKSQLVSLIMKMSQGHLTWRNLDCPRAMAVVQEVVVMIANMRIQRITLVIKNGEIRKGLTLWGTVALASTLKVPEHLIMKCRCHYN